MFAVIDNNKCLLLGSGTKLTRRPELGHISLVHIDRNNCFVLTVDGRTLKVTNDEHFELHRVSGEVSNFVVSGLCFYYLLSNGNLYYVMSKIMHDKIYKVDYYKRIKTTIGQKYINSPHNLIADFTGVLDTFNNLSHLSCNNGNSFVLSNGCAILRISSDWKTGIASCRELTSGDHIKQFKTLNYTGGIYFGICLSVYEDGTVKVIENGKFDGSYGSREWTLPFQNIDDACIYQFRSGGHYFVIALLLDKQGSVFISGCSDGDIDIFGFRFIGCDKWTQKFDVTHFFPRPIVSMSTASPILLDNEGGVYIPSEQYESFVQIPNFSKVEKLCNSSRNIGQRFLKTKPASNSCFTLID